MTLILASIIEKEAGTVSEMTIISGVFHNRLKNACIGILPYGWICHGTTKKEIINLQRP